MDPSASVLSVISHVLPEDGNNRFHWNFHSDLPHDMGSYAGTPQSVPPPPWTYQVLFIHMYIHIYTHNTYTYTYIHTYIQPAFLQSARIALHLSQYIPIPKPTLALSVHIECSLHGRTILNSGLHQWYSTWGTRTPGVREDILRGT
jgi:hypothetical protein